VSLAIYNLLGQKVADLMHENQVAGDHQIVWDGFDSDGIAVASGIYFVKLSAGSQSFQKKMTVLR
jgi:flagellar hook assembly protein FlgD